MREDVNRPHSFPKYRVAKRCNLLSCDTSASFLPFDKWKAHLPSFSLGHRVFHVSIAPRIGRYALVWNLASLRQARCRFRLQLACNLQELMLFCPRNKIFWLSCSRLSVVRAVDWTRNWVSCLEIFVLDHVKERPLGDYCCSWCFLSPMVSAHEVYSFSERPMKPWVRSSF
jgi:hypothetical protein